MSRSLVGSSRMRTFGSLQEQAGQLEPAPLATGEVADAGLLLPPVKPEPLASWLALSSLPPKRGPLSGRPRWPR